MERAVYHKSWGCPSILYCIVRGEFTVHMKILPHEGTDKVMTGSADSGRVPTKICKIAVVLFSIDEDTVWFSPL
jgi:hypothetical protein